MDLFNVHIAICDDEETICITLQQIVNKVLINNQIMGEVEYFTSGHHLLERIEEFSLAFLDMDMPEMDGTEVGMQIRQCNPECRIVIASAREDRFKETYDIQPLRFISKPFNEIEIEEAIQTYLKRQIGFIEIEVFKGRRSYTFMQRDIQYIASCKGGVEIVIDMEVYHQYVSLDQMEKELEEKLFFKVHKSYIVNMRHITKRLDKEVIIANKVTIPISRRNINGFREAYMKFDIKHR